MYNSHSLLITQYQKPNTQNLTTMPKILITGASGFIGSFLVEEALKKGYDVYAAIRKTSNKEYLQDSRIKFVYLDYEKVDKLKMQLSELNSGNGQLNYIVHCAGVTKAVDKSNFEKVNYQYTKNLIEALLSTDIKLDKFVYISTLAVCGPGNPKTNTPIKITDPRKPVSLYGKSKLKSEQFIEQTTDLPYIIFRPTGVYGAREKDFFVMYKMINKGIETYIGTKKQLATFIHVEDLINLIFSGLQSNINKGAYFATDGNYHTSQEFSEAIKQALNKKTITIVVPKFIVKPIAYISDTISKITKKAATLNTEKYKDISPGNWLCDSSATFEDFNFKPKYDIQKGLKETIAWYKQNNLL